MQLSRDWKKLRDQIARWEGIGGVEAVNIGRDCIEVTLRGTTAVVEAMKMAYPNVPFSFREKAGSTRVSNTVN